MCLTTFCGLPPFLLRVFELPFSPCLRLCLLFTPFCGMAPSFYVPFYSLFGHASFSLRVSTCFCTPFFVVPPSLYVPGTWYLVLFTPFCGMPPSLSRVFYSLFSHASFSTCFFSPCLRLTKRMICFTPLCDLPPSLCVLVTPFAACLLPPNS